MVEHSAHHPKVKGSSPASAGAGTKWLLKKVFRNQLCEYPTCAINASRPWDLFYRTFIIVTITVLYDPSLVLMGKSLIMVQLKKAPQP
jgi:hypothetical protein